MPPSAIILSEPQRVEYTPLDMKLIKAYYLKQSFMSGNFPVWVDRHPRVRFEVKEYTSNSQAALERKQAEAANSANGGSQKYGRNFYAVPKTIDGGPLPTMRDYLDEQAKLRGNKQPSGPPRG